MFLGLTVQQLAFVAFAILGEAWFLTDVVSGLNRPYYEEEQEKLDKILSRYDKKKAELDGGNTTVYIDPRVSGITRFSEKKLEATLVMHPVLAWKELNIQAWNTTPYVIGFRSRDKLWIPNSGFYYDDPKDLVLYMRRDQIVFVFYAYKVKANCRPKRTSYFNSKFKCVFRINLSRFTANSPQYKCVHRIYRILYRKGKLSDLMPCRELGKHFLSYLFSPSLRKWKFSQVLTQHSREQIKISFYMSRRQLHNLTPDIVGSIAMGLIISCQFLMTITGGYRLLIGLFGLLIATNNVITASELPGALPLPLELDLGLLLLQVAALAWCLVSWCLQWRAVKVACGQDACLKHCLCIDGIREWSSEVNARQRDCNRMQRLVDDNIDEEVAEIDSGNAEGSATSGDNGPQGDSTSSNVWEWDEIVLVVDRLLFVVFVIVIIVLCSVF